jgi:hypothetical protein
MCISFWIEISVWFDSVCMLFSSYTIRFLDSNLFLDYITIRFLYCNMFLDNQVQFLESVPWCISFIRFSSCTFRFLDNLECISSFRCISSWTIWTASVHAHSGFWTIWTFRFHSVTQSYMRPQAI